MKELLPTILGSIIAIIAIVLMIVGLCILGTNYYDFRASTKASISCFQARWEEDHPKIIALETQVDKLESLNLRHEKQYQDLMAKHMDLVKRLATTLPAGAYIEEPKSSFNKEEFKNNNGLQ